MSYEPSMMLLTSSQWVDFLASYEERVGKPRIVRVPLPQDATTLLLRSIGCLPPQGVTRS